MAANWMRRTLLTSVAAASVALLTACGSSETANSIRPDSIIVFGDTMSDIGQNANGRAYSVTDGSYNNWTTEVAYRYDLTISPAKSGGTSYAQGNARVSATDEVTNAPSVTAQIDSYLAANPQFGDKQFVLMSGGMSDIIAGYNDVVAGTTSADTYLDNMDAAGKAMAAQVRRLHDAGAPRVLAIGTPNLGRTLWAKGLDTVATNTNTQVGGKMPTAFLESATTTFNNAMLNALYGLSGTEVLYSDVQYYFNSMTGNPSNYSFSYYDDPLCNSIDSTDGLNIGVNQVNASLCTTSTVVDADKIDQYLFSDLLNYTPYAQRQFGDWIYNRMKANW